MDSFFSFLIFMGMIIVYTILVIAMYKKFFIDNKDPDAVLSFNDKGDTVKAEFLLLLPYGNLQKIADSSNPYIKVEVRNYTPMPEEDSQELQSL